MCKQEVLSTVHISGHAGGVWFDQPPSPARLEVPSVVVNNLAC